MPHCPLPGAVGECSHENTAGTPQKLPSPHDLAPTRAPSLDHEKNGDQPIPWPTAHVKLFPNRVYASPTVILRLRHSPPLVCATRAGVGQPPAARAALRTPCVTAAQGIGDFWNSSGAPQCTYLPTHLVPQRPAGRYVATLLCSLPLVPTSQAQAPTQ